MRQAQALLWGSRSDAREGADLQKGPGAILRLASGQGPSSGTLEGKLRKIQREQRKSGKCFMEVREIKVQGNPANL